MLECMEILSVDAPRSVLLAPGVSEVTKTSTLSKFLSKVRANCADLPSSIIIRLAQVVSRGRRGLSISEASVSLGYRERIARAIAAGIVRYDSFAMLVARFLSADHKGFKCRSGLRSQSVDLENSPVSQIQGCLQSFSPAMRTRASILVPYAKSFLSSTVISS